MGTPRINIGTARVTARLETCWAVPITATVARVNHRNILPESPINILAGLKLYLRKPKLAPAKITANIATVSILFKREWINRIDAEIKATPQAKPSILSKRLKALVIATTQKIVKSRFIKFKGIISK